MKETSIARLGGNEAQNEAEMPKGYISLKNGSHQGRLTLIRSDVNLPPYLGEFGLNAQAITNLGRMAGFRTIRIVSSSKDISETMYGLQGGVGRDGTIRGSLSAASTIVPEANSDIVFGDADIDSYVPRGRMWSDLTINLNTKEMQERIRTEGKAANDKTAWAHHINSAIANEVLKKGAFNLLRSGDARNDRDALIQGPLTAVLQELLFYPVVGLSPQAFLAGFLLRTLADLPAFSYWFRLNTRRGNGPARASIFGVHAPAVDRTVALLGLAESKKVNPMVKPLQPK